jgi:hypothetical protein
MATAEIRFNRYCEPLGIYAEGFLDSAVAIFARANAGEGLVDFAFYPGAYCLRHGLELFIKQTSIYAAYIDREPALLYSPNHHLAEQWAKQRPFVAELLNSGRYSCAVGSKELAALEHGLDVIDDLVEELDEADSGGMLFRYPECVSKQPRTVTPTPPAEDAISLHDWHAKSASALVAVQSLLAHLGDCASIMKAHRGEQFISFQDHVIARCPEAEQL